MGLSIICSIIQNVFISWAVDPNKASKVGIKRMLFGNYNNNNNDEDEDDLKKSKQYSIAMFSISYNEDAMVLMALFTLHLIRRIKNRTVYGLSLQPHFIQQPNIENIQPVEQIEQIQPIQMGFNPNNVIIEQNNIMNNNILNNNIINGSGNPNSLSSNYRSERVNIIPNNRIDKITHKKKFKITKKYKSKDEHGKHTKNNKNIITKDN